MTLQLTQQLQQHLGLLSLRLKTQPETDTTIEESINSEAVVEQPTQPQPINSVMVQNNQLAMPKPELEKNEFRLLVKILKAIGHDCVFDQIEHNNERTIYHHPSKDLVFHDITKVDDEKYMYLSSLADMNSNPKLKRAVWEKLKTLS